jgi:alcohol dehydrogenase
MDEIKFAFALPTRIVFGAGVIQSLAGEARGLGGRRIMLVCDPGIVSAVLSDRIISILTEAGVQVKLFSSISPASTGMDALTHAIEAGTVGRRLFQHPIGSG